MHPRISALIAHYEMSLLPVEETYFAKTYCSAVKTGDGLPIMTHMMGLFAHSPKSQSYFHRLTRDETWCFYEGDAFPLYLLYPDGRDETIIMGADWANGERRQFTVPAGVWQAAALEREGIYALYGCVVAPGFTEDCFEPGYQHTLLKSHPHRAEVIGRLGLSPP